MKTKHISQAEQGSLRIPIALLLGAALVFAVLGVTACSGADTAGNGENDQTSSQGLPTETVSGTIVEIYDSELMVSVVDSTTPAITDMVRVDVSQIDNSIVMGLHVGDPVTVSFSGAMGMSDPPFVSATELKVL